MNPILLQLSVKTFGEVVGEIAGFHVLQQILLPL
jgi:hypothetical protein